MQSRGVHIKPVAVYRLRHLLSLLLLSTGLGLSASQWLRLGCLSLQEPLAVTPRASVHPEHLGDTAWSSVLTESGFFFLPYFLFL